MPVQFCQYTPGGNTVACGTVGGYAQSHIFHIRHDSALTGGIEGKFRAVGCTGRSHEQDRADIRSECVLFCDRNGTLQVDVDLSAALLHSSVVDRIWTPLISGSGPVISAT